MMQHGSGEFIRELNRIVSSTSMPVDTPISRMAIVKTLRSPGIMYIGLVLDNNSVSDLAKNRLLLPQTGLWYRHKSAVKSRFATSKATGVRAIIEKHIPASKVILDCKEYFSLMGEPVLNSLGASTETIKFLKNTSAVLVKSGIIITQNDATILE